MVSRPPARRESRTRRRSARRSRRGASAAGWASRGRSWARRERVLARDAPRPAPADAEDAAGWYHAPRRAANPGPAVGQLADLDGAGPLRVVRPEGGVAPAEDGAAADGDAVGEVYLVAGG